MSNHQATTVNIITNVEERIPAAFIRRLQERGITINISKNNEQHNTSGDNASYQRTRYTTNYPGVQIQIKKGERKEDIGIISILHIFGSKLYLCGTEDLTDYADIIAREIIMQQLH